MGVSFRSESSWQAANTRVTGRAHAPCRRPRLRPARPPRSRRGRPLAPRSPHPSRAARLVRRGRGSRGRAGGHGRAAPRAQLQPRARRTAHSGDGACAEGVHGLCWDGHGRHRGAGGGGGRGGEGGGRFGWVLRAVSSLVSSRGPRFPARGERADSLLAPMPLKWASALDSCRRTPPARAPPSRLMCGGLPVHSPRTDTKG